METCTILAPTRLFIGMASDRYAGWFEQVYTEECYRGDQLPY